MDNGRMGTTLNDFNHTHFDTAAQSERQHAAAVVSREQMLAMRLAGTVSIPLTFPELGQIHIRRNAVAPGMFDDNGAKDLIVVRQQVSPKVIMTRSFLADDVAAVFIPNDVTRVDLADGTWLAGLEVASIDDLGGNSDFGIPGIAYVKESAPSLLNVDAGITAAESAEYYPPLADDRSANHYQFRRKHSAATSTVPYPPPPQGWAPVDEGWPPMPDVLQTQSWCPH